MIKVSVPAFGESISEGTVASIKNVGDSFKAGATIAEIETDKVTVEVPAPADGKILKFYFKPGDTVHTGELFVEMEAGAVAEKTPAATPVKQEQKVASSEKETVSTPSAYVAVEGSPSLRRRALELGVDVSSLRPQLSSASRQEKRVPMTRMRQTVAKRLLEVQQNTAMLTTFNEVNMKPIMDLRNDYKDKFAKVHNTKLGFMSFFVTAVVEALKRFPAINASIDGTDVVYHGYYDVSIAVSTEKGLVVPVIRDADRLSMAGIETAIVDFASRARDGKLALEEMTGGTFTITNGGGFGSLLSTPILNAPQSAILGMHAIQDRVVVEDGQMVIRPMMYLALSYDHRLVDGKDSVTFLKKIKELLEHPTPLILNL